MKILLILFVLLFSSSVVAENHSDYNYEMSENEKDILSEILLELEYKNNIFGDTGDRTKNTNKNLQN